MRSLSAVTKTKRRPSEFPIFDCSDRDPYLDPDQWLEVAPRFAGSLWLPWQKWLADNSYGQSEPPAMGASEKGLRMWGDAPGTYVHQL